MLRVRRHQRLPRGPSSGNSGPAPTRRTRTSRPYTRRYGMLSPMQEHWVDIERDFSAPVEEVFGYLAEHENLKNLFGAKVKRLRDGDTDRNGVGSRRELKIGPLPSFDETVTQYTPNELIEYKITRGTPLDGHVGIMRFSPTANGGTHFHYRIRFASKIPGVAAIVSKAVGGNVRKGLNHVPGGS